MGTSSFSSLCSLVEVLGCCYAVLSPFTWEHNSPACSRRTTRCHPVSLLSLPMPWGVGCICCCRKPEADFSSLVCCLPLSPVSPLLLTRLVWLLPLATLPGQCQNRTCMTDQTGGVQIPAIYNNVTLRNGTSLSLGPPTCRTRSIISSVQAVARTQPDHPWPSGPHEPSAPFPASGIAVTSAVLKSTNCPVQ